jgi:hypothetical protein
MRSFRIKLGIFTLLVLLAMLLGLVACGEDEGYVDYFETVWRTVNETYFDPSFGGLDWREVHDRYQPLIAAAEDDQEFYRLVNDMLWELNVSHGILEGIHLAFSPAWRRQAVARGSGRSTLMSAILSCRTLPSQLTLLR